MTREPSAPDLVTVRALAGADAATIVWRADGRLRVTVIAKATFALVPAAPMTPVPTDRLRRADVHHGDDPGRSLHLAGELAPRLPRVDVIMNGHACAPEGTTVPALLARLSVFSERSLVDRGVYVYGDRDGGDPSPFDRVPLVYERAYGGALFEDNPVGVGADGQRSPNLVDPVDAGRAACFGPLSPTWPERRRLLRGERPLLDQSIAEIPADFDWTYLHAAPPAQRVDELRGDEWIYLEGVHATHARIQSRLPGASATARVTGVPGDVEARMIALRLDTVHVDADDLRCSLTWRDSFLVPSEAALAAIRVVAGVALPGKPIVWPAVEAAPAPPRSVAKHTLLGHAFGPSPTVSNAPPHQSPFEGTMDLSPGETARAVQAPAVPFPSAAAPPAPAPPRPEPPRSIAKHTLIGQVMAPAAPPPPSSKSFEGTLDLSDLAELRGAAAPAIPFVPAAPAPAAAVTAPPAAAPIDAPPVVAPAPKPRREPGITIHGIRVLRDGPVAIDVFPWGMEPSRGCITIVAKATCDLVNGGPAVPRSEPAPPCGEVMISLDDRRHCAYPSDLVPFKVRADVVLTGHAYAPEGSATSMEVRLRFGGEDAGFDRALLVVGDRRWNSGKPTAPAPFDRVPLVHARAFGGPRFEANPDGMGHLDRMSPEPRRLPNLEDPDRPIRTAKQAPPPACFAPIPLAWKDRWARLGRARDGWPCLPEDLDWTRFQAAPRAQQLPFLRGDEPFALSGVHGKHAIIEGELPALRARCFAAWGPGEDARFEEIPLHLDTVVFEPDALRVSLVWRGVAPVPDEQQTGMDTLHVLTEDAKAEGISLEEARGRLARR